MFVQVRLLTGWHEPLWYAVPAHFSTECGVGTVIKVPLRNRFVPALINRMQSTCPFKDASKIKEIQGVFTFPADTKYADFAHKISLLYHLDPSYLYSRLVTFLHETTAEKEHEDQAFLHDEPLNNLPQITLTAEQQQAVDLVQPAIINGTSQVTLLQGVTGSGKTEVYKRLMEQAIAAGKSVIVLLPEVSLAFQFERLFKDQLSCPERVFSFHSLTKRSERRALWDELSSERPLIIVGVHLPVFLPIRNLGLIIVDEEHERGFVEKKHPKINSKEAALLRAQLYSIPILLGSATPSLAMLSAAWQKKINHAVLSQRFGGQLPVISHVLLSKNRAGRRNFWITRELDAGIADRLSRGEQVILYLNRRGYSFCAQCPDCGFLLSCDDCSVSLTPHQDNGQMYLLCHYCGKSKNVPESCSACGVVGSQLITKGIGTQQLVTIIQKLFPTARVARADLDSTKEKREWVNTVAAFKNRELDILIGTQIVTKGYHFPGVTLVGVVWGDLGLSLPHYSAREEVLQKLIQVAGRAGRTCTGGQVIVQTMAQDPLFDVISEALYDGFCNQELAVRQSLEYPPSGRLVQLEFMGDDASALERDVAAYTNELTECAASMQCNVRVLGPVVPVVQRIAGVEMRHVFIKGASLNVINKLIRACVFASSSKSRMFVVPTI